nr:hypothetical protein [Mycobacterium leprae]
MGNSIRAAPRPVAALAQHDRHRRRIGSGLFGGSGVVIHAAGSAAFLTYAVCDVLSILVMRMLGEMVAANLCTGSFADSCGTSLWWLGWLLGWLAVPVLMGNCGRIRGCRWRVGHHLLAPYAVVAACTNPDGHDP